MQFIIRLLQRVCKEILTSTPEKKALDLKCVNCADMRAYSENLSLYIHADALLGADVKGELPLRKGQGAGAAGLVARRRSASPSGRRRRRTEHRPDPSALRSVWKETQFDFRIQSLTRCFQ